MKKASIIPILIMDVGSVELMFRLRIFNSMRIYKDININKYSNGAFVAVVIDPIRTMNKS
jgi:hypothetical protein